MVISQLRSLTMTLQMNKPIPANSTIYPKASASATKTTTTNTTSPNHSSQPHRKNQTGSSSAVKDLNQKTKQS